MAKGKLQAQLVKLIRTNPTPPNPSAASRSLRKKQAQAVFPKNAVHQHTLALEQKLEKAKKETKTKKEKMVKKKDNIPYNLSDRILLVGEGNFSYALALSTLFPSAWILATSLDDRGTVIAKYPDAAAVLATLARRVTVLHGVDATRLPACQHVRRHRYTKIVFLFPHVGLGIQDQHRNVAANQQLLIGFFTACREVPGAKDTEVHVTVREGGPYVLWNIKGIARQVGYRVARSFAFDPDVYPGYRHRRTLGYVEGMSKDANEEIKGRSRTYIFITQELYQEQMQERLLQKSLKKPTKAEKKKKIRKSGMK